MINVNKGLNTGNNTKKKSGALSVGLAIAPLIFSTLSTVGMAAGYSVTEIPIPSRIPIPAGDVPFTVCLGLNDLGQVACHVEIVKDQQPTQADRFAPRLKVLASYAFKWDSTAPTSATNPLLLSSNSAITLDFLYDINNSGTIVGSTDTTTVKKPQGLMVPNISSTQFGDGAITKINDRGDYIQAGKLFVNNTAVPFPGARLEVQAINNSGGLTPFSPAGTQSFSSKLGESGTGILFPRRPSSTKPQPWFGISAIVSGVGVTDISDNRNFVVSGIPQTVGGLAAFSCVNVTNCNVYFPTVQSSGRTIPYIRLNAVDNQYNMFGTDGGFALMIKPTVAVTSNTTNPIPTNRFDLNSLLPAEAVTLQGWHLTEATNSNSKGQVIGLGVKGAKRVGFMLTPI